MEHMMVGPWLARDRSQRIWSKKDFDPFFLFSYFLKDLPFFDLFVTEIIRSEGG